MHLNLVRDTVHIICTDEWAFYHQVEAMPVPCSKGWISWTAKSAHKNRDSNHLSVCVLRTVYMRRECRQEVNMNTKQCMDISMTIPKLILMSFHVNEIVVKSCLQANQIQCSSEQSSCYLRHREVHARGLIGCKCKWWDDDIGVLRSWGSSVKNTTNFETI